MYDYAATMDEEFSFQRDDIIAVFAADPDGWWQGVRLHPRSMSWTRRLTMATQELLDDTRRKPGAYVFPSNFTVLLE